MNERIETEINKMFSRYDNEKTQLLDVEKSACAAVADYFYALALYDIRQVVEIRKKKEEELKYIANQEENLTDFIKYCNRITVYNEILDCIDNLTK